jgi:hypothetical protein
MSLIEQVMRHSTGVGAISVAQEWEAKASPARSSSEVTPKALAVPRKIVLLWVQFIFQARMRVKR